MQMVSSSSGTSIQGSPTETAPTRNTKGLSSCSTTNFSTYSYRSTSFALQDVPILKTLVGNTFSKEFLITFMRVAELSAPSALTLYFVSSWAIRPLNHLKVLGILIVGCISINTFLLVQIKT